jgi:DNA helicase II / ATP-dependent DNA helicase PcrA
MFSYLTNLNDSQREAVETTEGPLMIVAGAGSGKTKVLTTRIAHLMANGVDAFNILALTFTNKAAAEMKERVQHILQQMYGTATGNETRNLYIGTFHSVFARILRVEAHHLGYPNNFTIYDTDDARSVIKTVSEELNLDTKHYKPNMVGNRISAKNGLVGPEDYAQDYYIQQEDMRANRQAISQIYARYVARCFKNGAMDFDDLLFKMYELLSKFPEVLHKYQHKFKYVLVDEYQDTNPVQYKIVKLLGDVYQNVCVVGDDAQSIYSFRGATIENILQFKNDYDDAKTIKLEQNYRSTKTIIQVANDVIANNKDQIKKELWTANDTGEKIKMVRTMTDNDEGRFVADAIKEQQMRNHYFNKDFAILYRTNAQSRAYEENLRRLSIPYVIYGGISFYQRKEVKDLLSYLRFILNPQDEEAFKRIINYPTRGIGKTTIQNLTLKATENNITIWQALNRAGELGFKGNTLENLNNFATMIKYFQGMMATKNAYEIAFMVGKDTSLVKELFNDKTAEGLQRYENVQELLNSIKEYTETPDEEGEITDKSLGAYLQQITLLTDNDAKDENSDAVKLMTVHAAKGLEFNCVFVGGMEEGLFPSGMSINTREELEEERRLFYVAVTRAKQKLWLTYANNRYRFGQLQMMQASRFLDEIDPKYLDAALSGGGMRNQTDRSNWGSAFERMHKGGFDKFGTGGNKATTERKPASVTMAPKPSATKEVTHIPSPNFEACDPTELEEGMKIEHQKFGFGIIKKLEGSVQNPMATIHFDQNGEKKIMVNYAKLMIIK